MNNGLIKNPFNNSGGGGSGGDVPNASISTAGKVQLSNAIDSDSQSTASTPLAIKTALTESKNYTDKVIEDLESTLIKHSFQLKPAVQGQLEFDMPAIYNQNPKSFVNLLYFNSTKVLESKYSITEKVVGDSTQGFKLVLSSPAPDYQSAIYNLLLVGGKALSIGGGGSGAVNSVNNISPDTTGNVQIPNASLLTEGVVQLTNVVDDFTEDKAVTPKAIKEYFDNFVHTGSTPPTNTNLFWNKV